MTQAAPSAPSSSEASPVASEGVQAPPPTPSGHVEHSQTRAARSIASALARAGVAPGALAPAAAAADPSALDAPEAAGEPAPEPTGADARRLYIDAQRAVVAAQKQEKRARALAARAQQFSEATSGWQQDPAKILHAAGIDPRAYSQAMIESALRGGGPPPVDPVVQQVEALVAPYVQALEREKVERTTSRVIAERVLPLFTAASAPELLLAQYGGDARAAAIAAYQAVEQHYNQTGEVIPFPDAVEQLERGLHTTMEDALKKLRNTKKFGAHFAAQQEAAAAAAPPATRAPLRTLSQRENGGAATRAAPPQTRPRTEAERRAAAIARALKV